MSLPQTASFDNTQASSWSVKIIIPFTFTHFFPIVYNFFVSYTQTHLKQSLALTSHSDLEPIMISFKLGSFPIFFPSLDESTFSLHFFPSFTLSLRSYPGLRLLAQPKGFVVAQLLSRVRRLTSPWTATRQASLSFSISQSLLKFLSIDDFQCLISSPDLSPKH